MNTLIRVLPYTLPMVLTSLFTWTIIEGWYWLGPFFLPITTYFHRYIGKFSQQELYKEYTFFHHHPGMEYFRLFCALFFLGWNALMAWWLSMHELAWYQMIVVVYSLIIFNSNFSITLAHDLMHSKWWISRALGALLLWINGFHYLETDHIYIHHINAGTDRDPASAFPNEALGPYLLRSILGRMRIIYFEPNYYVKNMGKKLVVLNYVRLMVCIAILIFAFRFNAQVFIWLCAQYILVPIIYETITYIQHYGLRRRLLPNGKHEGMQISHSWNCYYRLSAYLHFMMPVHSIHHMRDDSNLQGLKDPGPSFPFPFSRMVVLAFIPILWFKHMNPILEANES